MNKPKRLKIILSLCLAVFLFAFQATAFAEGRSSAGGGKLSKFDSGKWMATKAIGLGAFIGGAAVAQGIGTSWNNGGMVAGSTGQFSTGFNAAFNTSLNLSRATASHYSLLGLQTFPQLVSSYALTNNIGLATNQIGSALGMNPKSTLLYGSILSGTVGGALNPGNVIGASINYTPKTVLAGASLGALQGAVEGAILSGVANERGELPYWAGPIAGLAGNFSTNLIVGGFSPFGSNIYFSGEKTTGVVDYFPDAQRFSFKNSFNLNNALSYATQNLVKSLPSTAVSMAVNSRTQDMDWQDRQIVQAAFKGVYPIVGRLSDIGMSKAGLDTAFKIQTNADMDKNNVVFLGKNYINVANPGNYEIYNRLVKDPNPYVFGVSKLLYKVSESQHPGWQGTQLIGLYDFKPVKDGNIPAPQIPEKSQLGIPVIPQNQRDLGSH